MHHALFPLLMSAALAAPTQPATTTTTTTTDDRAWVVIPQRAQAMGPGLPLATAVRVTGCVGHVCSVVADDGTMVTVTDDVLAKRKPTSRESAAMALDAITRACAAAPTPSCLLIQALAERRAGRRQERATVAKAMRLAVGDTSQVRFAVAGETSTPPTVRDGEDVVTICGRGVSSGRVRVRSHFGANGYAFFVEVPCADGGNDGQLIAAVAGLPEGRRQMVDVSPTASPGQVYTLGDRSLREVARQRRMWLADGAGHRAALDPKLHGRLSFVGDLDGDAWLDVIIRQEHACSEGTAQLLLSSKSPGTPSLPTRTALAPEPIGICD